MNADGNRRNANFFPIISLIILILLAFQAIASFRVFCLPEKFNPNPLPIRVCDPDLWPFLSYPMYDNPHYLGEQLNRPRMFGILKDNSKIFISFKDMGLTITQFINLYDALRENSDINRARMIADLFTQKTDLELSAIQLAKHPVIFTEAGFIPTDIRIVKTFWFDSLEGGE